MTKRQLKAAVTRARAGKGRARFSVELKVALRRYAEARRAEGAAWSAIGEDLGLGGHHVSRMCQGGRLQEVAIVAEASPTASLTLTLPGGAEVTGLDVQTLAALLRVLS
jgi:hypothetical protein